MAYTTKNPEQVLIAFGMESDDDNENENISSRHVNFTSSFNMNSNKFIENFTAWIFRAKRYLIKRRTYFL